MELQGKIDRIIYKANDNPYYVLSVSYRKKMEVNGMRLDGHETAVVTGTFAIEPKEDNEYIFYGEWTNTKRGPQFTCDFFKDVVPATKEGIVAYLGTINGIGPKTALLIVKHFGTDTVKILDSDPDRISEVKGIGKKRASSVVKNWNKNKKLREIMFFLYGLGLSSSFANKIYRQYGEKSIETIRRNPYALSDDIGFAAADKIALQSGYIPTGYERIRAGIIYYMRRQALSGHCLAYTGTLIPDVLGLLNLSDMVLIQNTIQVMSDSGDLYVKGNAVFLKKYYEAEGRVADKLTALACMASGSTDGIDEEISEAEKELGISLDPVQRMAVRACIINNVTVITGGPGTGKTTITKVIIYIFEKKGLSIHLAAPTGRASKKMNDATERDDAMTIHRLLAYDPTAPTGFQVNADNPLDGDVVIADESSMIDILLMDSLLDAVLSSMKVVLIGDVDQLPSVGAGNVLRDIIDSDTIPVIRLTKIFRQAKESRIITNAHLINDGKMPDLRNGKDTDFFFMKREGGAAVAETILKLVGEQLPRYYKCDPASIQVLLPMRKGDAGIFAMNDRIRGMLNPNGVSVGNFRIGDKVMQTKNNYDKGVFNGDIGFIRSFDENAEEGAVKIDFDGRIVNYEADELDELMLAYACTVHKSQGSEYDIVVLGLSKEHYPMLARNLLYTAVTRAKKICIVVGDLYAIERSVGNNASLGRNTGLKDRLIEDMSIRSSLYCNTH